MLPYHEYDNYKDRLMGMCFFDNSNIMNKISKEKFKFLLIYTFEIYLENS